MSRSVKQISTGSIYVLGNSDTLGGGDITLSKLDADGNLLWTNYYGTANQDNGFNLNLTTDGNLVFAGESVAATGDLDVIVFKVDTLGGIIWNKFFSTSVNETAKYIEQTTDGGFVLAGAQNDATGMYDNLILKLDSNGDYQWHQALGRTDNEYADMVHQIGTNYILTADTRSFGAGGYDVILYNLDSLGNENWSQTYGDSLNNGCQGLLLTSDGNYLSYGETEIYPSSAFNFYLQKIDASGASMWRYTYGGTGADAIFSAKEDVDGGFICTGYSNSYNGFGPLDLVILKFDSLGTFLWKQTYGGAGIDIGYDLIPSVDGNGFIITGKTFSSGTEEYYLLKLNENGLLSGIQEGVQVSGSLQLNPNPAAEKLNVNYALNAGKTNRLVLMDVLGKTIREIELTELSGRFEIDVQDLKVGLYFCALYVDGILLTTQKVVIEH